jgi:hypothetical protein
VAPRLKSDVWVQALVLRCKAEAVPALVAQRGDKMSGAILVRVNRLDGTSDVYQAARTGLGEQIWIRGTGTAPVEEAVADKFVTRQMGFDPDVWVVEIDDRQGRHFLQEPVE